MTDGDSPFPHFTVRAEGYDRGEVDAYIAQLQGEVGELRSAAEADERSAVVDSRLHDPEGAVTRIVGAAQEMADRVTHDAQVEADRLRAEAEEQASVTVADADARAAQLMADIETRTAEVRAEGIAAARTAIRVERDKAVAELGQIRRVRDDIRAEAVELKAALDRYARQSTDAAEALAAAADGPLMTFDLPEFVPADVALAGVFDEQDEDVEFASSTLAAVEDTPDDLSAARDEEEAESPDEGSWLFEAEDEVPAPSVLPTSDTMVWGDDDEVAAPGLEAVGDDDEEWFSSDLGDDEPLADVISIDSDQGEALPSDSDAVVGAFSGAFLSEVRAAADDEVAAPSEDDPEDSDRFLSELRGVTGAGQIDEGDVDDDAADRFFDVD